MVFEFPIVNEVLAHPYLQNKYIVALLILVGFSILAKLVLFIFSRYLEKFAKKTKTKVDDLIFEKTKSPIFYLILVFGLKLTLEYLGWDGIFTKLVESLMALVFVFIIARGLGVIIESWGGALAKKTKTNIDEVLLPLFLKTVNVVSVIIAAMWVLNIWSIDITPYLAGVGLGGLVLGMALQDSLKNILGGVSIILDKNFQIGDAIRLESGELGTIKDIGLRSTKMLTYDNEVIFVPNGQLANMRIRNYQRPNNRVRKIVEFGVEYGTDPEKVKKVVLSAMKNVKDIFDDPYMDVIFVSMGDSAINFQARFWADWDNAYSKWIEVTQVVYAALNKAGIEIPFPTRTVIMKDQNS